MDPDKLAQYEAAWSDAYHNRDWPAVEEAVTNLREAQYGIRVPEAAPSFVDACKIYIDWKKALKEGKTDNAKALRNGFEEHLKEHFHIINDKLEDKAEDEINVMLPKDDAEELDEFVNNLDDSK